MMRKIVHTVIWIMLLGWFTVLMSFVTRANEDVLCGRIVVDIPDSSSCRFITPEMVREQLAQSGIDLQGYPVEEIRTRELERIIEKAPHVSNAEVFINIDGELHVKVDQRKPLVRMMPGGKSGYYLDEEGIIIPLSDHYSPLVLLVSGELNIPVRKNETGISQVDMEKAPGIRELLDFASYVDNDPFWKGQIVQLYRTGNGEYEIIPRVGAHQILFGTMDEYEKKLGNIKLLYDQGFRQYGWNTYDKINVKYSNQIICTKR